MLHASDHEVDDRRRGIDYAKSVGYVNAEASEELFIDGIEELLLFGKLCNPSGGAFDGNVERVKFLEKLTTAETSRSKRVNNQFNLLSDDIAMNKVGIVEHSAKQPFG